MMRGKSGEEFLTEFLSLSLFLSLLCDVVLIMCVHKRRTTLIRSCFYVVLEEMEKKLDWRANGTKKAEDAPPLLLNVERTNEKF